MQLELTFQRAAVHPVHDKDRLQEGKDLNDALLDFFVKLGQSLVPEQGRTPSVAYLGSHFYDVLRKGGVKDGREGHRNVAKWARRQLGKQGLFGSGIGALAVPVNELLTVHSYDGRQEQTQEKHWWLALLLNPQAAGGCPEGDDRDVSMLCLDSFVRTESKLEPPVRALKNGDYMGYPVEVSGLSRVGFNIKVYFSARGDGTAGPLPEPRKSRLRAGGRVFTNQEIELKAKELGGQGKPGRLEGALSFRLDRRGAAKTVGQYSLEFGDRGDNYEPQLKLRMGEKPTACQAQVAHFIGGYLDREKEAVYGPSRNHENGSGSSRNHENGSGCSRVEEQLCLPGVPQQETSHDCGFFIMEMILRTLQLSPKALRELATASSVEIAMLPWPSQQQILRRKAKLRDIVETLFAAARRHGTGDVEILFKVQPDLKGQVRSALMDGGPSFTHGFDRWAAGDWDLSPSPSRSTSRSREKKSKSVGKRASRKRSSSSGGSDRRRRKRRRSSSSGSREKRKARRRSRSSTRSRSRSSSASASGSRSQPKAGKDEKKPPAQLSSFTRQDLDTQSISTLREHCVQRGVLPPGIVERSDLVAALARFAVAAPAAGARTPAAATPAAPKAAAGPTASIRFNRSGLEAMSTKELRGLCVQKGVLPPPPLERGDLIQALAPFAAPG